MLRHVVVWSMSPGRKGELGGLVEELRRLPDEIEEVDSLSVGRLLNESEYDAVLCVDVADEPALARYRAHPAHQPALIRLGEVAERVVVADYKA
jgi:Stress responsive A/B Barrel Domain